MAEELVANIVQKDDTHWEVLFEGIPDWVIPLIKIVPKFYTSDEYSNDWDNLTFDYDFNYFWEKVSDTSYKLYFRLSGQLRNIDGDTIPLYVDLSAWIVNTQNRNNVQHQLGY